MPGTKLPAGNFLLCLAILLAGGSASKVFTIFGHNFDVHSCETSETATVSKKKYNDLKDELAAVLEHSKSFEELCKRREDEFQQTVAAMQRCIDELEGILCGGVQCI